MLHYDTKWVKDGNNFEIIAKSTNFVSLCVVEKNSFYDVRKKRTYTVQSQREADY